MSEYFAAADLSGLPPEGLAVVGFSGGADSMALAHWLSGKLPRERLVLAHVNHLLRGEEAERDQAAAQAFAQRLGVRFALLREDVGALAREKGLGLEECGRQVRYAFFHSLAKGEGDRVLTAHNAQDNAETVLLHLARGTGLSGLCGIPPRRGKVLRPFLSVRREEIEAYCREMDLPFVTDSTNLTGDFSRNLLRRQVFPVLEGLNPRFVESVLRAAELLSRDRDCLEELSRQLLERARLPWGLEGKLLLDAGESLGLRALGAYLREAGCRDLERRHLESCWQLLVSGGALSLPGGVAAQCRQGVFYAWKPAPARPFSVEVSLGETALPGGQVLVLVKETGKSGGQTPKIHNSFFKNALDCAIITGRLRSGSVLAARTRQPGDRFCPVGQREERSLKHLFQQARVPAPCRDRAVVLTLDGRIAWCQGLGASREFAPRETESFLLPKVREGDGNFENG